MKNKLKIFTGAILTAFVVCVILSCTSGSIDSLLDEYEKIAGEILECAQEAERLSNSSDDSEKILARYAVLQKKIEKFEENLEKLGERLETVEDDMTEKQTERFMRITLQLASISDW